MQQQLDLTSTLNKDKNNVLIFDGGHFAAASSRATKNHVLQTDDPTLTEKHCLVDIKKFLREISFRTGLSFSTIYFYQGTHDGLPNSYHNILSKYMTVKIHEMKIQSGSIPSLTNLTDHASKGHIVVERGVDVQIGTKVIECCHGLNGEKKASNIVVLTGDADLQSALESARTAQGMSEHVAVISMQGAQAASLESFAVFQGLTLDSLIRPCVVTQKELVSPATVGSSTPVDKENIQNITMNEKEFKLVPKQCCSICKKQNHAESSCFFRFKTVPKVSQSCSLCKKGNHSAESCFFRVKGKKENLYCLSADPQLRAL